MSKNVVLYIKNQKLDMDKSAAMNNLLATYSKLGKVVCARNSILTPRAIVMRIAVDLVVWSTTAPYAEAVQCGLHAVTSSVRDPRSLREPRPEDTGTHSSIKLAPCPPKVH